MSIQLIGYVRHHPPHLPSGSVDTGVLDIPFIDRAARIHEDAGYDSVLIGHASTLPDAWLLAAHIAGVTRRLGVLIATRPGLSPPTLLARRAVTLEHFVGPGRVGMHIITGGNEVDQHRDGDFLPHDERYRRSGEFMEVLKRMWRDDTAFDYEGAFYRFEGARCVLRPSAPDAIRLCFAGRSEPALAVGARFADTYLVYGEPLEAARRFIENVRAIAAPFGRCPGFGLALRLVVGRTEAQAWDKAHSLVEEATRTEGAAYAAARERVGSAQHSAVGHRILGAAAEAQDVYDERLWMGYARLTGGGGTSSALVGTAAQVADALMRYYDLGIRTFYIRGWDLCEDTAGFGEELIPRLRRDVAARREG